MTGSSLEAPEAVRGEPQHGNAYNIFILLLTVLSLGIMVCLVLPLDQATLDLLGVYDNIICVIFLVDFTFNLRQGGRDYFIKGRGWLDLLGSIPSFGWLRFTALLRLFRLSRLARLGRLLRGKQKTALIEDVLTNRGQYAVFITLLAALLVLTVASTLVLQFESRSPNANITTGGDALWWAFVTITTVGYGDKFPVTGLGRLTATAVMFAGVGIIGALASILASLLVPPPKPAEEAGVVAAAGSAVRGSVPQPEATALEAEMARLREEMAALRRAMAADGGHPAPPPGSP